MLIPKCCKGCSNRKSGMCCCTLPSYCNEWVEDDETYPTNVGGVINTPNTAPSDIKIGDPYPCGSDGTNTELQKHWWNETWRRWNETWRNYEQDIGNRVECPDCKEKDHRIAVLEEAMKCLTDSQTDSLHQIAVLEKALWNTITIGHSKRYYKKRFYRAIEQAEKELEEESK